jgi:ceramide glucosyltransferase
MTDFGLALVLGLAWAYLIGSTIAALRFARRRVTLPAEQRPVSVLKPLHGAEPGLCENLRSFVDQDYPEMQVVFGVRHGADAALPVARELIGNRPEQDIALVVNPRATGSNLKVANLENMLPAAKHEVIVLADSDMRVDPRYLASVTAPLQDPRIGAVTCLYKGMPFGGLWSRLGAMHINFAFLPSALLGEMLKTGGGCFGATIALRRATLQRIGGFARIRDELADDHRLGDAVRQIGLATVLSPYIVENHVAEPSLASLWRHELRWARTVRAMAPFGFAGSIITHTIILAVLAAAAARNLDLPTRGFWLLPLRDILSFAVFIGSFCGRSVLWRDQLFRVGPGGRMTVEGDKPV